MSEHDEKKQPRGQPLQKSNRDQEESPTTGRVEYVREDRQIVRDELPPVYPDEPEA